MGFKLLLGQEDYDYLRPLSYTNADAFIIFYSISSESSLCNVKERWIKELRHHAHHVPVILVGTKSDLRNAYVRKDLAVQKDKLIPSCKGEELAWEIGASGFYECSSLTQENLSEVFDLAVRSALKKHSKNTKPGCCIVM